MPKDIYAHISDQELLEKFKRDEDSLWLGILLQRYTLLLLGVCMKYLKEEEAADRLEKATAEVIAEGKYVTYDLKKDRNDPTAVGTSQMADAIIARLKK